MSRHPPSIDEFVGTVGAELRGGVSGHPSARELTAYHRDELTDEEMERIRDHLSLCRDCADLVLDVASFAEPEAGSRTFAASEGMPAAWESLRSRLPDDERSPATVIPFPRKTPRLLPRSAPIAAALVVAVVCGWMISRWQSGEAPGLGEPQLTVPVQDLFPRSYRRGSDPLPSLEVPTEARIFLLQLNLADAGSYPDYFLRIVDAAGGEIWSGNGLRRTAAGNFRIALPRRLLPAGQYGIELYGVGGSSRTLLERFDLSIEYP